MLFDGTAETPEALRRRSARVSRLLRMLRAHHLIQKVSRTHRYILTTRGRDVNGKDTFYRRIVFPCLDGAQPVNLYGLSLGGAAPHRFLPRPKGSLFAWSAVDNHLDVILVEGLFDLAVLWQAGFLNTTCAFGVHLTPTQLAQLIAPAPLSQATAISRSPVSADNQTATFSHFLSAHSQHRA